MNKYFLIFGILLILMLSSCQIETVSLSDKSKSEKKEKLADQVILTINGEEIYKSELDDLKSDYNKQTGNLMTDDVAEENIILNTVLIQEAKRKGIFATDNEVEILISAELQKEGKTLSDLKKELGAEYREILEENKDQLIIEKLMMSIGDVKVSDEQVREFYDMNTEAFKDSKGNLKEFEEVKKEIETYMKQVGARYYLKDLANKLASEAEIKRY